MRPTVTIVIQGGEIRYVHDDDVAEALRDLGPAEIRRASNVEPEGASWVADMGPAGGPVVRGPRRSDLIAAEVEWLEANAVPWPRAQA